MIERALLHVVVVRLGASMVGVKVGVKVVMMQAGPERMLVPMVSQGIMLAVLQVKEMYSRPVKIVVSGFVCCL